MHNGPEKITGDESVASANWGDVKTIPFNEKIRDVALMARTGAKVLQIVLMEKMEVNENKIRRQANRAVAAAQEQGKFDFENDRFAEKMISHVVNGEGFISGFDKIPAEKIVESDRGFDEVIKAICRERIYDDGKVEYEPIDVPTKIFEAILANEGRREQFEKTIVQTGVLGKYVDKKKKYIRYEDKDYGLRFEDEAAWRKEIRDELLACKKFGVKLYDSKRDDGWADDKNVKALAKIGVLDGEDVDEIFAGKLNGMRSKNKGEIEAILELGLKTSGKNAEVEEWARLSREKNCDAIAEFDKSASIFKKVFSDGGYKFDYKTRENAKNTMAEFDLSSKALREHFLAEMPEDKMSDILNGLDDENWLKVVSSDEKILMRMLFDNESVRRNSRLPAEALRKMADDDSDFMKRMMENDVFDEMTFRQISNLFYGEVSRVQKEKGRFLTSSEEDYTRNEFAIFLGDAGDKFMQIYNFGARANQLGSTLQAIGDMKMADIDALLDGSKWKTLLNVWEKIHEVPGIHTSFFERMLSMNAEQIGKINKNINRLTDSNSYEIVAGASNLISVNLANDDFDKNIDGIEAVFLKNNLPYVGKVFRTFQILYPEEKGFMQVRDAMERGALKGRENWGWRGKQSVLWNDLLKTAIGSSRKDLREYVENLQRGEGDGYLGHLMTLYNQTERGKKEPFERTDDAEVDVKRLEELFGQNSRRTVADAVVRSFGYGLGIKTANELLQRIDEQHDRAEKRNRERAEKGDFRLVAGDMLKTTDVKYLGDILQNGSVCKEFLNGQVSSDHTPLDADLNVLSEQANLDGSVAQAVDWKDSVAAFGAMHCLIVLKGDAETGRGRFATEGDRYRPEQYEIWNNGANNYGIRTGFPSSEIDFLVYNKQGKEDYYGDLERMKFEVARNGLYIPIVDKDSGECVFMPEDYDKLRKKMGGVSEYGFDRYEFADNMDVPGMAEIMKEISIGHEAVEKKYNAVVDNIIKPTLAEMGLEYKSKIDGDLIPGSAQVINTGSTGRGDNVPGDGDFDLMIKVDREILTNDEKMRELRGRLAEKMGVDDLGGNFRKVKWLTSDGEETEIDITFAQKTNKVGYSTDMALKDRLDTMRKIDAVKTDEAVANIIYAKKFFRQIGAYKPKHAGENPQGGMGGAGVENWILNNGGSFVSAAKDFMRVANNSTSFADFCSKYSIFDFGENHGRAGMTDDRDMTIGTTDNFVVNNMNDGGYAKIKTALGEFLKTTE